MERQTLCSRVHDHYSDAAVCIPELEPVLGWHAPRKAAAMMTMYFFIIG
jgi:hypothetical protein